MVEIFAEVRPVELGLFNSGINGLIGVSHIFTQFSVSINISILLLYFLHDSFGSQSISIISILQFISFVGSYIFINLFIKYTSTQFIHSYLSSVSE